MAHATAPRPATGPLPLPEPIRRALGQIDRRLRALAALRGLGTAGLTGAVVAAAGMAADFVWGLPGAGRWAAWAVWVAAASAPLAVGLARALAGRSRALELAAVVERGDPTLGDRLTNAVDLLGGRAHGSPALIAALADDASARAGAIHPHLAAPSGGAGRRFAAGLAAVALVAAPAVVKPDPFGRLARRFLAPWAALDRVGLYTVAVAPGDAVAALGEGFAVTARVAPRVGQSPPAGGAAVEWVPDGGRRTRRLVMAEAEPVARSPLPPATRAFTATLRGLTGSLRYRVVSGSGESRWYRVTAVDRPGVASVAARVEPPAYTRQPAADARNPARVEAWEGSRVRLTVASSTPLRAAEVSWPVPGAGGSAGAGSVRVPAEVSADGRTATALLTADASGDYAITLRDRHGLPNRPEPRRRVVVRPDEPPVVALRGEAGLDEARPDDTLRAAVVARDDLAVATVELHYTVERAATSAGGDVGPESGKVVARLPGLGTRAARGEAVLALKPLGLKPGDVVAYRARATDDRPAPRGPNVAWSEPMRLTVVARADTLWTRRGRAGREEVQKKLDALKKAAAENRHETEQLRYAADAVQRGNGKWDVGRSRELSAREADARALAEQVGLFARDVAAEPAFRALARPARQVAEVEAEAARAMLDKARQAGDDPARFADLRQADTRLAAVSSRLEELQRELDALAEREADRRRLQALADRQAGVAEKAGGGDPHAPPGRARLDQLAAEQNAVRNDLDALLKKSPELRAGVLAAQGAEAEDLARRARELAGRQREEARRATDFSKKADVLRALADEQRALEDDARRLALDVDRPLADNGRSPLNTGAIRQAAPPIERGELPIARQHLQGAEGELRRFARDLEDAPADLKALARRLAQKQEQIHNDLTQAMGETRNKDRGALKPDQREAVAAAMKPLAGRQKAVARLAAAVTASKEARDDRAEPKFPRDAAREAAEKTGRAADALRAADNPREAEAHSREARDALNRLANELPDAWKRDEPVRRAVEDARRDADEVAHQVDQHLRETDRPHDKNLTPARASAELAGRLAPHAERARKAAERLDASGPGPRLRPQRDRAARRARALADAIEAARARAPKDPNAPAGFDADADRALRDALAVAAVGSRAAFERLAQKLNGVTPDDDVAAELADEQRALSVPDKDRTEAARAGEQRRLATALRTLHAPDAPLEQAEAVRLADRAAKALAREDLKGDEKDEAVRGASEAAEALADRLADRQSPRGRAEALARAERGLNDPEAPADPAAETARQRAVAAELARLPGKDLKEAGEAVRRAIELTDRAFRPEEPGPGQKRPTPADRAAARTLAALALDALAARLPAGSPEKVKPVPNAGAALDPDLAIVAGHADRARELARRERRVRERLQAVLAGRVAPQQDLRRESAELGRDLADLRDRVAPLSDRARGPAAEGAAVLGENAPRAMDEAVNLLAQGQTDAARNTQRQAAQLAEQGAQKAEDLAAALHAEGTAGRQAEAGAGAGGESKHRPDPGATADAREAVGRAAQSLGQARDGSDALGAARRAMQGAAEKLQAAAEAARGLGDEPGEGEGEPGGSIAGPPPATGEPKGSKAGVAEPETLRELQDLVRNKTGRNWGELPGHLRTEILQMSQGRYRDDYARLIQLYFREIAAGAGSEREVKP